MRSRDMLDNARLTIVWVDCHLKQMSFNSFYNFPRSALVKEMIFLGQNDVMFQNQSTSSQKFQAHPRRRPEEADELGRVIQFQMSSRERLFEKLMTHPQLDEAHSNAP